MTTNKEKSNPRRILFKPSHNTRLDVRKIMSQKKDICLIPYENIQSLFHDLEEDSNNFLLVNNMKLELDKMVEGYPYGDDMEKRKELYHRLRKFYSYLLEFQKIIKKKTMDSTEENIKVKTLGIKEECLH